MREIADLDALPDAGFDNLTRIAATEFDTPHSLVSLIDYDRDCLVFCGQTGLVEPLASQRKAPLDHALCRVVAETDAPLVICDARLDPRVSANPAVAAYGIAAYMGVPVRDGEGMALGALCVGDFRPRAWTSDDVERLERLAACVTDRFALIGALNRRTRECRRAEAASEAKSMFLATMSHELRTPLNGILPLAELLQRQLDDPKQRHTLTTIHDAGKLMLSIVDTLLDHAKIEAGGIDLNVAAFHPAEVVRNVGALHAAAAAKKGISLDFNVCPGGEIARLGDAHRLQQILGNLISNAIKFTATGGVLIELDATPGQPLVIDCLDSGIGMTEAEIARVVHPFEQAPATAGQYGGTGLGLSIVVAIVEAMKGTLRIDSTPGYGSRFHLSLPLPMARRTGVALALSQSAPEVAPAVPPNHDSQTRILPERPQSEPARPARAGGLRR
ncbi:MAG: ATP-binding protein [Pseudomonadota bacterium]